MSVQVIPLGTGKCSTFGGPNDEGVSLSEPLALVNFFDLMDPWFARNFLPPRPHIGMARSLNPKAFYCAMRFAYGTDPEGNRGEILPGFTRDQVRRLVIAVSAKGKTVFLQPLDWGPNRETGRLIDLSPQALVVLDLNTDDPVDVAAIVPGGVA